MKFVQRSNQYAKLFRFRTLAESNKDRARLIRGKSDRLEKLRTPPIRSFRRGFPVFALLAGREPIELMLMLAEAIFQSTTMLGRLGFPNIALTRQNDRVGEQNPPFQAVHAPIVFDPMCGEVIAGQVRQGKVVAPEIALKD